MTRNQIMKALKAAGFNAEHVFNVTRDEVEVLVVNVAGEADEEKTEKAVKEATAILGWGGGYWTGYGSMVLQASPIHDAGDWNDTSSQHHY